MRILLVDDDESVRSSIEEGLAMMGFEVVAASSVKDALQQIVSQKFDVLVTDLHLPDAGDGFGLVTAMRHVHPDAQTIILSGFPDVDKAMNSITLDADRVLSKPIGIRKLSEIIHSKSNDDAPKSKSLKETVANILEREVDTTVERWLWRVEKNKELAAIPISTVDRTSYVPEIVKNIVTRLRKTREIEVTALHSPAAVAHGTMRKRQGYTAALIIQESRILQVSIFETIQRNLNGVDFSRVLPDVMLIADEVDSQLSQCIESFLQPPLDEI
jgi:ActR/RegA family two-component response regulator